MKALYLHENYYVRDPKDGDKVYSAAQFHYGYWQAYIEHFDHLTVVGRDLIHFDADLAKQYNVSSGSKVSFELMPNLSGPKNLIRNKKEVRHKLRKIISEHDAVILRNANEICWLGYWEARKQNKPIAVEMTGCQWDAMWHFHNPLAKFYAPTRYLQARYITKNADQVIYVSEKFLQNRYPTNAPQSFASNVRIEKPKKIVLDKRLARIKAQKKPLKIGLIGALNTGLKGIDVAIKAISPIISKEPEAMRLHVLGNGDPSAYDALIKKQNLSGKVSFDGVLPTGDPVHQWLDDIDIYIQPSFHEGLPRATIEAMSRGCPVLGSTTAGIPELVPQGWTHKPGDHKTLSFHLEQLLHSVDIQSEHAKRSFKHAQNYTADKLAPKRHAFWSKFAQLSSRARQ